MNVHMLTCTLVCIHTHTRPHAHEHTHARTHKHACTHTHHQVLRVVPDPGAVAVSVWIRAIAKAIA